jgi:hypothetical protein
MQTLSALQRLLVRLWNENRQLRKDLSDSQADVYVKPHDKQDR